MYLNQLNLNELRVFAAVYRRQSMTFAARELHLTQSGVSQHIASLEKVLGLKLFDRVHRNLIPTPSANELFLVCSQSLQALEDTVNRVRGESQHLRGVVRIGAPSEFGNNILLPALARFAKLHPDLNFEIYSSFSSDFLAKLLEGALDFAIVDEFVRHPAIVRTEVYKEQLDLCVHPSLWPKNPSKKDLRQRCYALPFVDYDSNASLVTSWLKHQFGKINHSVRLRATVSQVQSLATLICSGVGAGILPHHLSLKLKKEKTTLEWVQGPKESLTNRMSLADLKGRTHSPAPKLLKDYLVETLRELR